MPHINNMAGSNNEFQAAAETVHLASIIKTAHMTVKLFDPSDGSIISKAMGAG